VKQLLEMQKVARSDPKNFQLYVSEKTKEEAAPKQLIKVPSNNLKELLKHGKVPAPALKVSEMVRDSL